MNTEIKIKSRRGKKYINRYFYLFLLFFVIFIGAAKDSLINFYLEQKFSNYFGAEVNIGSLSTENFFTTLNLSNVELCHPFNPMVNIFTIKSVKLDHSLLSLFQGLWTIESLEIIGISGQVKRTSMGHITHKYRYLDHNQLKANRGKIENLMTVLDKINTTTEYPDFQLKDAVEYESIKKTYDRYEKWEYELQNSGLTKKNKETKISSESLNKINILRSEKQEIVNQIQKLQLHYKDELVGNFLTDLDNLPLKELADIFWHKYLVERVKKVMMPIIFLSGQFNRQSFPGFELKKTSILDASSRNKYLIYLDNIKSKYEEPGKSGKIKFEIIADNSKKLIIDIEAFEGIETFNPLKSSIFYTEDEKSPYQLIEIPNKKIQISPSKFEMLIQKGHLKLNIHNPDPILSGFKEGFNSIIEKSIASTNPISIQSLVSYDLPGFSITETKDAFTTSFTDKIQQITKNNNHSLKKNLNFYAANHLKEIKNSLIDNLNNLENKFLPKEDKVKKTKPKKKIKKAKKRKKSSKKKIVLAAKKPKKRRSLKEIAREQAKKRALEKLKNSSH